MINIWFALPKYVEVDDKSFRRIIVRLDLSSLPEEKEMGCSEEMEPSIWNGR